MPRMTAPTVDTLQAEELRIDTLLADFQSACGAIGCRGTPHYEEATKHRAILRNELRAALLAARREVEEAECELTNVSNAISTVEFMDPPDGGNVSLSEQVRRMRSALLAARRERDRAVEAWSRTEGECLKLEQEVRDLRTALNATLAAQGGTR